jgi:hypothetical protein
LNWLLYNFITNNSIFFVCIYGCIWKRFWSSSKFLFASWSILWSDSERHNGGQIRGVYCQRDQRRVRACQKDLQLCIYTPTWYMIDPGSISHNNVNMSIDWSHAAVDFKEMERRIKADNDARSGSSLCRSLGTISTRSYEGHTQGMKQRKTWS